MAKKLKKPDVYLVEIEETLIYKIEVEANSKEEAEELAFQDDKFVNNISSENDSKVLNVEKLGENYTCKKTR